MVAVYHERESRQELKAGVWRQELRQRLWKSAAFNLSLRILFRVLSYRTEHHLPRGGITHSGCPPFPPSSLCSVITIR